MKRIDWVGFAIAIAIAAVIVFAVFAEISRGVAWIRWAWQ